MPLKKARMSSISVSFSSVTGTEARLAPCSGTIRGYSYRPVLFYLAYPSAVPESYVHISMLLANSALLPSTNLLASPKFETRFAPFVPLRMCHLDSKIVHDASCSRR